MKKILMLILFVSYVNAQMTISTEMITDSMMDGVTGMFKEITGQNDEQKKQKCQKEYKELYERNSQRLAMEKQENQKLKQLIYVNSIQYIEATIDHIQIKKHQKCTKAYWNYFKSTNHDISQISNENRKIKTILTKHRINYAPLLKDTTVFYKAKKVKQHTSDREKAKEELKRQMNL